MIEALYANMEMNKFFGSDVISPENGRSFIRTGETASKNKEKPIERKVFKKRQLSYE